MSKRNLRPVLQRYCGALFLLLMSTGAAFADQFYFQSPGNDIWSSVGAYVNPYVVLDKTTNKSILVYCDDWNTDFSGNPTWNANVYSLTPANLPFLRFGNVTSFYNVNLNGSGSSSYLSVAPGSTPDAWNRYLEAAWLDDQWITLGGNTQTRNLIAAAQWTLFVDAGHVGGPLTDPTTGLIGAINSSGYATGVYDYLQAAQTAVAGGKYTAPGWDVIVPAGNTFSMQEFLFKTAVPEPGSIILLGSVAGLLAFGRLRRNRRIAPPGM